MPIVGANLYEIGYGPICADIFPKNIVKYPLCNKGGYPVSAQLLLRSGQEKWLKMDEFEADAGDEVTVSWGGDEFKCKVVEVKAGAVKVHYVGWGAGYDEWVSTEGEDNPLLSGENETGDENPDQRDDSTGDQSEIFFKTF